MRAPSGGGQQLQTHCTISSYTPFSAVGRNSVLYESVLLTSRYERMTIDLRPESIPYIIRMHPRSTVEDIQLYVTARLSVLPFENLDPLEKGFIAREISMKSKGM